MKIYRIYEQLWGGGIVDAIVTAPTEASARTTLASHEGIQDSLRYYTKDYSQLFQNAKVFELGTSNQNDSEVILVNLDYSNCY